MNDLTARLDPPKEENEDFEAERIEYEDEHGVDNWGSDPGYITGAFYDIGIRLVSIAIFYLNVVTIIELSK